MLTKTKYIETAKKITSEIVNKGMKSGDKLDPEHVLLKRYNVSRMTLRRSLDLLEKQKLIRRQRPKGTFIDTLPYASFEQEFQVPHFLKRRNITLNLEIPDAHRSKLKFWDKAIRLYEDSNKGVKINLINILRLKDIDKDQAKPDVLLLPAWSIPHYTKRNMLAKVNAKNIPGLFDGFSDSLEYGMPLCSSPRKLYLNCNLAAKLKIPQECFNGDFNAFKKGLLEAASRQPFKLNTSVSIPGYIAAGGDFDTAEGRLAIPGKVAEVFEFFADLHKAGVTLEENTIIRGEALWGTPSGLSLDYLEKTAPFKIKSVPQVLTQDSVARYIPSCVCVSATATEKDEALKFAVFLSSPAVQKLITETQYGIPACRQFTDDTSMDSMKPFSAASYQVPEYMETVFMPISRKVINNEITVPDAVNELREKTILYNNNKIGWMDNL
tara:strand:+ start:129 stop:1442 length:1314 start_codon:yes stop_codon:yes gene_type:complete